MADIEDAILLTRIHGDSTYIERVIQRATDQLIESESGSA